MSRRRASEAGASEELTALALRMLAARPRSERQLRERLIAKTCADPAAVDAVIARMKELGYVDDSRFARGYARYRVSTKPVGRARVAQELAGKKVPQTAIREALDSVFEETDEESLIERAIEKRIRTHGRPSDRSGVKRMFDHLMRLGFQYDLIMRKLGALKSDDE